MEAKKIQGKITYQSESYGAFFLTNLAKYLELPVQLQKKPGQGSGTFFLCFTS